MFRFSIDRGGTFTDVYAECPDGKVRTLKLLSDDPGNYRDAPTEAIRRILEEVTLLVFENLCKAKFIGSSPSTPEMRTFLTVRSLVYQSFRQIAEVRI